MNVDISERPTVLLDHAQDKVVVLDEDGTFCYVNAAAERILGFPPEALEGENAFEYIHPEDREEVRATFEAVVADSDYAADTAAYRHRAADGSWVWLESRVSNLTDGTLAGYVVSSREITDRVEAQRERRETEARLSEIAATTDDVLWMFDGEWREVLFCNPAYEELFGMPVEELESRPRSFLDCVHPDDVPVVEEAMERLSAGEAVDVEYRVNPTREYDRWVWVQGEPIVEDREVVRIVGFCRDVTDRRRRERQLVVMDNLLRHNLRNRLTTILGNADLVEEEPASAPERVAVIRREGERLLKTAEKQRDIVELLTRNERPQPVCLADAAAGAIDTIEADYPDAEFVVDLPDADVRALDEVRFVLVELVENALQHAEGAPTVELSARVGADTVELVVRDDCPPIPDYDRQVLTGDHEMDDIYHSSGCGLWLVYWIVDLSGGDIAVESGPDGNAVTVTLPRAMS
ncbi:MAG: PAS domain S-box protein [Halobacteriaceae archaeon]